MKKSRFLYLDPNVNPGKVAALEDLQAQYAAYLGVCVASMLAAHKFSLALKDKQAFFPACEALSSQIVKNVRDYAISIVSGWAAGKYTTKLKSFIKGKFRDGEIDEATRSALYILGKRLVDKPGGKVNQEALDLYWSWLLDEAIVGKTPGISSRCGMRMSEMTAVLSMSTETKVTQWWLGFSYLQAGKARIQLPLAASPYVKDVANVSKGVLARKTKQGRWCFEVTKAPCEVVNPAYSSQTCPSCGYVSRSNRSGIKFVCRACGRKSHADAMGGLNLLGRSEDKEIPLDDHPSAVKAVLRRRFAEKRRSPVGLSTTPAPAPSGRRLTTGVPHGSGTASNQVVGS